MKPIIYGAVIIDNRWKIAVIGGINDSYVLWSVLSYPKRNANWFKYVRNTLNRRKLVYIAGTEDVYNVQGSVK